jgi:hypothetical protein
VEADNARLKQRFGELVVKKANGVLRDEYLVLEQKYQLCLKEINKLMNGHKPKKQGKSPNVNQKALDAVADERLALHQ